MPRHSSQILELAKRGAQARLHELANEAKLLLQSFPHLRDSFDKDELPLPFIMTKSAGRGKRTSPDRPQRRRRRMSAAARKAVSARMKKYWAGKRKAKKGPRG